MGVLARTVKRVVRLFGYRINRAPRNTSSLHEEVLPFATLAPWNTDAKFAAAYSVIRNFTLVDKYRCFELWQLTAQVAKLPQGAILEVGVWRGGTGALSARQAADCKIIEMVYLCDTFTGVVKASKRDHTYQGGEHSDTSRRVAEKLTTSMGLGNTRILQGIFPEDTGHEVEQVSFRLCTSTLTSMSRHGTSTNGSGTVSFLVDSLSTTTTGSRRATASPGTSTSKERSMTGVCSTTSTAMPLSSSSSTTLLDPQVHRL